MTNDQLLELIANLSRRVHSLEIQLRDTQNNIERQGVEIAEVAYGLKETARLTESHGEDIRFLDERTKPTESSVKIYDFTVTNFNNERVNVDVSFIGKPTAENIAKAIAEVIGE